MKKTNLLLAVLILFSVMACNKSAKLVQEAPADKTNFTKTEKTRSLTQAEENRRVLYSAFLDLIVENVDSTSRILENMAQQYDGYINRSSQDQVILRIKSETLEAAMVAIDLLGEVKNKNMIGQDVTEEYHDYQIRLDNALKTRVRYLQLLDKAETVEAAIKVERELERLNQTIDLLKGKLKRLNHLSEYATITINLRDKKKPGVLGYVGLGLYHSVKWLFVRN